MLAGVSISDVERRIPILALHLRDDAMHPPVPELAGVAQLFRQRLEKPGALINLQWRTRAHDGVVFGIS
jgi:hypothetical protein